MTAPTLWIEIRSLASYFDSSVTPTGIPRVQIELIPRIAALAPGRVRLVGLGAGGGAVTLYRPQDLAWLTGPGPFAALAARPGLAGLAGLAPRLGWRRLRHAGVTLRGALSRPCFADLVRPGDVILNLGSSWSDAGFPGAMQALARRHRMRVAVLVHDIIPLSQPEYANAKWTPGFRDWFDGMAGVWDQVLTPSRWTAGQVSARLRAAGQRVPPISTVRFGAGFTRPVAAPPVPLAERRHVLSVGTIEGRKNHALLVEVWRRLIARHGPDRVPDLVFAGRWGWQVDALAATLRETGHLGGKVRIVTGPTDDALAVLYHGARYTAFPSFCEGWGLPVGESLSYGRHCIASNATAIPEAGEGMIELHDPASVEDALALHERAILDDEHLMACEARIRESWTPTGWDDTARAILSALGFAGAHAAPPAAMPVATPIFPPATAMPGR